MLITVVDDDESIRESLPDLLGALGYLSRVFPAAEAFLASDAVDQTRCLILDVFMPGMGGPALLRELKVRGKEIPIIFITAHRDDIVRGRLLALGAFGCLFKPFSDASLLETIKGALAEG